MIDDLRATLTRLSQPDGPPLEISDKVNDVAPFLSQIRTNADAERDAFGFLPVSAYESAAQAGHLFVALRRNNGDAHLMGHLLFGGRFPHLRIHQLHVAKDFRKTGVARSLISFLVSFAERVGYMDIVARVASDLPANKAWEQFGFGVVRTLPGGTTRNRTINVRVKHLNTPTLFGYYEGAPVKGLPAIRRGIPGYVPVYAIDLNVFFDFVKQRSRSEQVGQLIAAALDNMLRIVVTEEFAIELKRNHKPNTPDPLYEFALQLPTISRPDSTTVESLTKELADIVFPERAKRKALTVQDNSDLLHLATAVFHTTTAFITSEKAMVAQGDPVMKRFGVRIVDVESISKLLQTSQARASTVEYRFAGKDLRISELTEQLRCDFVSIAEKVSISSDVRGEAWPNQLLSQHSRSIAVSVEGTLIAAAVWSCSSRLHDVLFSTIIADEDHPAIESAIDALLLALSGEAVAGGPALIHLAIPHAHTITREIALSLGFTEAQSTAPGLGLFQRLALGKIIVERNWDSLRTMIAEKTGVSIPDSLATLDSAGARVSLSNQSGTRFQIAFEDLETALSPALFLLSSRNSVIVPIRRSFADQLLSTSQQLSLLPSTAAAMFHERVYYRAVRNLSLMSSGSIIVFYESGRNGGRSAAIAIARVRDTAQVSKSEVAAVLLRHGVLNKIEIEKLTKGELVASTIFDMVIKFPKPVPHSRLKQMGAIDGANLITARQLTATQVAAIAENGGLLEQ